MSHQAEPPLATSRERRAGKRAGRGARGGNRCRLRKSHPPRNGRAAATEDAPAPEAALTAEGEEALAASGENNIIEIEEPASAENGEEVVESVGGADAMEEAQERTPRYRRSYKIQEVIKRRQIMLVQVVKEERGTKGAALTTYLSLAGRYSVLMPNTARGGGISRKITNALDRKKLKEIAQDLEVPEGMGVILRTAGANRTKTEVKRDFEYLLRHVGDGARLHAQVDRADAGLRGRLADQALDPRPLQQGHRGDPGRGRRRPPRGQGLHAHADAEPCQEREALPGHASRSSRATASRASSTRCSRRPCSFAPAATS